MSISAVEEHIHKSISVKKEILANKEILVQVEVLVGKCLDSLRTGGKIIFAGNGGSFADAQHLSAEFVSRFLFDRAPLASVVLGANSSAMSAVGNDYGFDQVFSRELQAIATSSDVFIPISTSGNSANIVRAVEWALGANVYTLALTGQSGGKLGTTCDCIRVPSQDTALIQESHIMLGHILCGLVEEEFFHGVEQ